MEEWLQPWDNTIEAVPHNDFPSQLIHFESQADPSTSLTQVISRPESSTLSDTGSDTREDRLDQDSVATFEDDQPPNVPEKLPGMVWALKEESVAKLPNAKIVGLGLCAIVTVAVASYAAVKQVS